MSRTAVCLLFVLAACSSEGASPRTDGGEPAVDDDAGPGIARPDSGPRNRDGGEDSVDAGSSSDLDAWVPPIDEDAGTLPIDEDAGPRPDGGRPTGPPSCSSGGQVSGSGGTEGPYGTAVVGICRMAIGCDSSWTPTPPPAGGMTGGTPNHKLLWRVWNYGWAQRTGTGVNAARDFLIDFFEAQEANGHQAITAGANEVLNVSHYQIWANGMTCARLLADVYDDPAMLDATGAWWRHEFALYDLLERGGSIDSPGARFKEGQAGPSQLRDTIYAMVEGLPLVAGPDRPTGPWWNDYYNVAAWTLRELQRRGDDLGGARDAGRAQLPRLSDDLFVRTRGSDYVFYFPQLTGALQPLFWVAHVGGTTTYAPYVGGTPGTSATMPPALPGATEFVVEGVR